MIKVKSLVGVLFLGIIIYAALTIANINQNQNRLLYKSMLLKGVLTNERHYEFLLSLREFNKNDSLLKQQVERYWGASTSEPVTLIDKLSLSISGRDYKVPSDAILELANVEFPCGVFIGERADTILVHLE
ncbi:MAG: hypothetical protein V3T75_00625, partial [candidate division Zixibacteria bacterium]